VVGSEPTFKKQKDDKKVRRTRKAKSVEKAEGEAEQTGKPSPDEAGGKDEA